MFRNAINLDSKPVPRRRSLHLSMLKLCNKEPEPRLEGSRPLDSGKLQAPCITRNPSGGYRLFYTAVGPAKPFPNCQGYILSAVSEDGLTFRTEPGIRLSPQPGLPHMSHRVLAPTVDMLADGRSRIYFEARGPADQPTVICSAVSWDMLNWEHEEGIRLQGFGGVGGPRFLKLPDGRGRLYCFAKKVDKRAGDGSYRIRNDLISAVTSDGANFEREPGCRFRQEQTTFDSLGITAAEVIAPVNLDNGYVMVFSEWQNVPPGTVAPLHPSEDPDANENGGSEDFATTSIAADMAGFRSRVYTAYSRDGLMWDRGECIINGSGYGGEGLDAVHAEDMSLISIGDGRFRMYYAACDKHGEWRIASAVIDLIT